MSDTGSGAPSAPARAKRSTPPVSAPPSSVSSNPGYQMKPDYPPNPFASRNQPPPVRRPSDDSVSSLTAFQSGSSLAEVGTYKTESVHTLASRFDKESLTSGGTPGTARSTASAPSTKSSSSSSLSASGEGLMMMARDPRISFNDFTNSLPLVEGEAKVDSLYCPHVQYSDPYSETTKSGKLTVTNFRVFFEASPDTSASFEIPLSNIQVIEKLSSGSGNRGDNSLKLRILCKDLRKIVLSLPKGSEKASLKNFVDDLKKYAFPVTYKGQLFAFSYKRDYKKEHDGWVLYDARAEYKRQGVPNDMWRIPDINLKYGLCETYPAVIAVPKEASNELLHSVAAFRSRSRIPVLSWIHPVSHATITRCSQPMVGLNGRRSKDDEYYVRLIHEANPVCPHLCIMDARPLANAVANKAKGGGYETEENYPHTEVLFLDIHNIHVMRESLRKVREMCTPKIEDPNHFLSNLDESHWLHHIKTVLAGALRIVDKIENYKCSVLVHCSDGWDRTAQLTALAMIMLDPYYRTILGFEVLIEKEWVSFGHKFAHRIGHGEEKADSDRSPVFLQFIDCVWQLTQQYPNSFEFSERLLIAILDNLFNCRYGTFLCNFEKEIHEKGLRTKTKSLWSFINSNLNDYRNPFYLSDSEESTKANVLYPLTTLRYLQLWLRYYARWDPSTRLQEPMEERYHQLLYALDKLTELRDNLKKEAASKKSRMAFNQGTSPSHVNHV
ncbi:myotubularin-related protein 2-like [Paramacrobiotus metropolitanus]|uniref:myotubularin-related protein 2-like n=1 Tax=Paramacrobiotus metropolitanus TaxID=2943436 RepID=UPI002446447A|nr:myotubularin-related protein 2-like [Paramacrobiotus metropolitanus]